MSKTGAIVIGCRHNTVEFIDSLRSGGYEISGIVGLNEKTAQTAGVPTWQNMVEIYKGDIPVYEAETYTLKSENDKQALLHMGGDVGFCIGWQRLIPDWYLDCFRNGIFGMHCCEHPLPNGRGRSPLNWSLIEGATHLHAHIFKCDSKADDGLLLNVTKFPVMPYDDIDILQQKCRAIFSHVARQNWDELLNGSPELSPQATDQPDRFYPKRTPDDGLIDWTKSAVEINDWIRAQTRPYPGAFVEKGADRYKIWRSGVAGLPFYDDKPAGQVVERFSDNSFLIKTGDGVLHVLDHDIPTDKIEIGQSLI